MIYNERNRDNGANEERNAELDFVHIHTKYDEKHGNYEPDQISGEIDISAFDDDFIVDLSQFGRKFIGEFSDNRILRSDKGEYDHRNGDESSEETSESARHFILAGVRKTEKGKTGRTIYRLILT